jgi:hypothetical protein
LGLKGREPSKELPEGLAVRLSKAIGYFDCRTVRHQAMLAYSVLTHEEIVDLVWEDQIRPLLIKRFPALSDDQIREAHAYAYGGSVIQDLGYYPFREQGLQQPRSLRSQWGLCS